MGSMSASGRFLPFVFLIFELSERPLWRKAVTAHVSQLPLLAPKQAASAAFVKWFYSNTSAPTLDCSAKFIISE